MTLLQTNKEFMCFKQLPVGCSFRWAKFHRPKGAVYKKLDDTFCFDTELQRKVFALICKDTKCQLLREMC